MPLAQRGNTVGWLLRLQRTLHMCKITESSLERRKHVALRLNFRCPPMDGGLEQHLWEMLTQCMFVYFSHEGVYPNHG